MQSNFLDDGPSAPILTYEIRSHTDHQGSANISNLRARRGMGAHKPDQNWLSPPPRRHDPVWQSVAESDSAIERLEHRINLLELRVIEKLSSVSAKLDVIANNNSGPDYVELPTYAANLDPNGDFAGGLSEKLNEAADNENFSDEIINLARENMESSDASLSIAAVRIMSYVNKEMAAQRIPDMIARTSSPVEISILEAALRQAKR